NRCSKRNRIYFCIVCRCQAEKYRSDLPKASIIICFYNEAWSTLIRTVHSVLNRTPAQLLHEIVLVDDASELAHLQAKLAEYLWSLHPNITLVRLPDRQGLIRARLYGAHVATGEVLVFLDSHCEVNKQWLEPLLAKVADSRRTIAIPVIDMINSGTFEYKESSLVKGGFNWGMHYTWEHLPQDYFKDERSYIEPIETPTMAGGLFAVNRQYFREKGEYDPGLDTWGGENLEISFRFWQCGGRLEIIPCSRVGHVFRQRRPYGSPGGGDSMLRNSVRVARVWMDDYIQYFFQVQPAAASIDYGNITARIDLRKKLECKPFQWYLRIIYPEQVIPDKDHGRSRNLPPKYKAKFKRGGPIKNKETGLCIVSEDEVPVRNSLLTLGSCDIQKKYQVWNETEDKELMLVYNLCLDAQDGMRKNVYAKLGKCDGMKRTQAWVWSIKNYVYQLYNPTSGKCLAPVKDGDKYHLTLEICTLNNKLSAFMMEER
ncbi:polypeptide N-acetylgalactosaminyltransferase 11-like, partial [Mercenaria mercenaria]|uniref:polypeptide N-acetylgalactosaminyltransferase 11-like n=1 Tax=Mercenaria mercenaria TaxID=6596 RepID=UPI00234EFB47